MGDRKQALLDDLAAAHGEVLAAVSALRPEQLERPSANEGWSAKDTLAHLSSIEARSRSSWELVLAGRPWPADAPDLDTYNARSVEERRGWSAQDLIAELERTGEETRRFVERLQPEDLDRQWVHPTRGQMTLETLVQIIPRHLRAHGAEIKAAAEG